MPRSLRSAAAPEAEPSALVGEFSVPLSTRSELPFYYPVRDAVNGIERALLAAAEAEPYGDLVVTITRK